MALEFLDGYNSIVTIYWTLIVDTVVNRMQLMLVKEEEISDIFCRPATMFQLTSGIKATFQMSQPRTEARGVSRHETEDSV